MKAAYYVLAAAGALVPLFFFLPWLQAHGLAVHLLVATAFETPVSAFAWADVVVSALALSLFMVVEGRARQVRPLWLPFAGLLTIGVSFALPLFLALREEARGPSAEV